MTAIRIILRETLLALTLVALGLFGLPACVYLVGQQLVGEYEAGLPGLYEAIADGLMSGHELTWLMILSPYLSVQIVRFWLRLGRPRPTVT